ncbi:Division initiation protein [Serinicoccus hydrothermalis]|uniref:Division initiation protein n=1 Tax=Serinicoccus hydrothermalis TaxID=1758689 RepID=A0A1B1N8N9_9MICO|nr:DUF881 domain-containing protein [Serinicoccus hydrothermalis]ANS77789.1 Division initiation protein [Serinicoccus hydrothermalis]
MTEEQTRPDAPGGPPGRRGIPRPRVRRRASPTQAEARQRLRRFGRFRPTRGQLTAALLTGLLGVALVAQARVTEEAGLEQLRETELVALLDDVTSRAQSLGEEVDQLEADRTRLLGSEGDAAAADAARERLESYQILAGTVPVQGPGITVIVDDGGSVVTQTMVLDGIQELRDAGAEAIQVGRVRVVASSYVSTDDEGEVLLDGQRLGSPYTITAVGDAHTLAGAMAIPGGFSDSLRSAGAEVTVVEADTVVIDALHEPIQPRYAQPVPSTEDP